MDQLIQKMQQEWELLDPNDKAQYKTKITKFKENYQKSKLRYRKVEDWIKTDEDRRKLNLKKSKDNNENFDDDLRTKLINGTGDLNEMDNKLVGIIAQGHDTADTMRAANKDLRSQRDVIISVDNKNKNIKDNLKQGEKVIKQISRSEMRNRLILYVTIFILFITDIVLAYLEILKIAAPAKN